MGVKKPYRFEVYLVPLDPTVGSEIKKTRPCVVISPDSMHHNVRTVIIAPMTTTTAKAYVDTRVPVRFKNKPGKVLLDQMRAVDKTRLVKRLGKLSEREGAHISAILQEMFVL